jgi:anaerobic ribonucleoside-triphosphate reductase activating protein
MARTQTLQIHRIIPRTRAEGPGVRFCVWVQGCSIRCPGCANPETWDSRNGDAVTVRNLGQNILDTPGIQGITLMGGEPFDQAAPLAALCREVRGSGLSVVTFTGHTLEHIIESHGPDARKLIALTDLLIDGPYIQKQRDCSRPWIGSANQRFHFLTDKYKNLETSLPSMRNRIEIRISPHGAVSVNGMANSQNAPELFKSLMRR